MMPNWFRLVLLAALGASFTVVLALLAAQVSYAGVARPLKCLAHADVRHAIVLSLACATAAALLGILLAVPAAYALSRLEFPGRLVLDALLDVPVILSPVALGLSLLLVFKSTPGHWFETYFFRVIFEVPGIVAAQFVLACAISIRVLKAAFDRMDRRLEHVARLLGCSPWGAFRRVTVPLSKPALLAAFILGWTRAVSDFGATVTLAGAVPGKTETMPVSIYLNLATLHVETAVALTILMTLLSVLLLVCLRLLGRRIA